MTLLRQLMIVITLLLLLLLVGNFLTSVYNSRDYLARQMQSHAQDTATSLGLSMTTAAGETDIASLELMASAVFDRGYFRTIVLQDMQGETIVAREIPVSIEGIPLWFTRLIDLPSPEGVAEIMDGWTLVGRLTVVSHPGYAYRDLWRMSQDYLWLYLGMLVLTYLLLGVVLRFLLRPLILVEQQAAEICDRKFTVLAKIPRTRELKRVVQAMNRMSGKLEDSFQQQLALTEHLRAEARSDSLTDLDNRREFDSRCTAHLETEEGSGAAALMILQIRNFDRVNDELGRPSGDMLLQQVAERFSKSLQSFESAIIARRGGTDFAAFLPNISVELARTCLESCFQDVSSLQHFSSSRFLDSLHLGMVYTDSRQPLSLLLTEADTALRNAQSRGASKTHLLIRGDHDDPITDLIKQADEWRLTLHQLLQSKPLLFHYQPVLSLPDRELISYEVFTRAYIDDQLVTAGVFLPMAERFGLLPQFDRMIIEALFANLSAARLDTAWQDVDSPSLSINISTRSVQDAEFLTWLIDFLSAPPIAPDSIILEVQDYTVHLAYDQVKQMMDRLKPFGYQFSIDHFGAGTTAFSYLHSLDIDFLKVDRSFVRDLHSNTDNQFFIRSVAQIAHNRDILLIAEGVEKEAELNALTDLNVDGAMGYLLGEPKDRGQFT